MNMASPSSNRNERKNSLRGNSGRHKRKAEGMENGRTNVRSDGPEGADAKEVTVPPDHEEHGLPESTMVDANNKTPNNAKSGRKRKKVASSAKGKRYSLRSSIGGGRVLRSMSKEKSKTGPEPGNTTVAPETTKRRKRRKLREASNDEFSVIRKRVRYLLTRMEYEQTLIDAYSGEGWKGQSAEKIRPEKELERAKSEILRCKFKVRELFRQLDSLSSEGRYEESLFDSDGQIDSEDIFCCKCGSKDLSTDNDIILCDGICDRGFHQKCLNPPLLAEDIPDGEEGWLCPACDCKVDCIELLNEFQGSNLSIKNTWEKVYPEAVAISNGAKQHDDLPSDDSEDYDYNPEGQEVDEEDHKEESDSKESDSTSASEDSDASDSNKPNENFGFPSDDSEDDDYDPDAPNLDTSTPKDGSSSNESDFTSDSDEFLHELSKTSDANDDSASTLRNLKPIIHYGEGKFEGDIINSEHFPISEPDLNQENVILSGKRHVERFDYKKLYNETYGKSSSDSSDDDDDDWSESAEMSTPNKGKKDVLRKESGRPSKANNQTIKDHEDSKNIANMSMAVDTARKSVIDHSPVSQVAQDTTPGKTHPALEHDSAEGHNGHQEQDSNKNRSSASAYRKLGEIATMELYRNFQENQYPSREKKESLAQKHGLTYRQVDKWFVNSRHSYRASAKGTPPDGVSLSGNDDSATNIKSTAGSNDPCSSFAKSSVNKEGKKRNPIPARQTKAGTEHGEGDGGNMNREDKDRQKAVARELRKMKQGRKV